MKYASYEPAKPAPENAKPMQEVKTHESRDDFRQARRGAVAVEPGKTRVTIRLDNDVLDWYRKQAQEHGGNYQTAINAALREQMSAQDGALERVLRRVIRKEMLA